MKLFHNTITHPVHVNYEYESLDNEVTKCSVTFNVAVMPLDKNYFVKWIYDVVDRKMKAHGAGVDEENGLYTVTAYSRPSEEDGDEYDEEFGKNVARAKARMKMFDIFSDIYNDIRNVARECFCICIPNRLSRLADKEESYIDKIIEARDIEKLSDDGHSVSEYNSLLSLKLPKRIVCSDGIHMLLHKVSFSEEKPLLYTCEYKSLDTERTITITGRSPLSVLRQAEALAVPDPNDFDETSELPY